MDRRVWIGSIATTMAWVNVSFAQGPSPTAPAGSNSADGAVFIMRTAGQPERRVKVIKSEQLPDGSTLTDVKDLATGAIFTLTNPSMMDRGNVQTASATETPRVPTPVAQPQPATTGVVATAPATGPVAPGTPRPLFGSFSNQRQQPSMFGGLPKARDRAADPLLANQNTQPTLLGKMFGDPLKDQPAPRVGVIPPQPQGQVVAVPQPQASPRVAPTATAALTTPPSVAQPIVMPQLAQEREVTAPKRVERIAVTPSVAIPSEDLALPKAISTAPAKVTAVPADTSARIVPATASRTSASELPGEIKVMILDLAKHKRPSFRMENATWLAESDYTNHPEVIAALMQGAKNDSTGVVRGHCITQLANLGYKNADFLEMVEAGLADPEPAVRRAANTAKSTLSKR